MKTDEFSIKKLAEDFEYGERNKNPNVGIEKQYNDIKLHDMQNKKHDFKINIIQLLFVGRIESFDSCQMFKLNF